MRQISASHQVIKLKYALGNIVLRGLEGGERIGNLLHSTAPESAMERWMYISATSEEKERSTEGKGEGGEREEKERRKMGRDKEEKGWHEGCKREKKERKGERERERMEGEGDKSERAIYAWPYPYGSTSYATMKFEEKKS